MMKKILLIIASPADRELIAAFLQAEGHEWMACDNLSCAATNAKQQRPDLVICESDLSPLTGDEIGRLFKNYPSLAGIPFILLTKEKPPLAEMEHAGFRIFSDDYLPAPLNELKVAAVVGKWLDDKVRPQNIFEQLMGPFIAGAEQKILMPWFKGKINYPSLGRLFASLMRNRDTGVLAFKSQRRAIKIFIREGVAVDIESNFSRIDSFGRYLLRRERISQQAHLKSAQQAKRRNIEQGHILLEMNELTPPEYAQLINEFQFEELLQVFGPTWFGSSFEFSTSDEGLRAEPTMHVPVAEIVAQGFMEIAEPAELRKDFAANERLATPIRLAREAEYIVTHLALDAVYQSFLQDVDGHSITELEAQYAERFEMLLRLAYLLLTTRLAEFAGESDAAVRAAGAAELDERSPANWDAQAYRDNLAKGQSFFNQYHYENARSYLLQALKVNPRSSQALALLAFSNYELMGKTDIMVAHEAKEMLKRAISLDDTNEVAYLLLGKIFRQEGKFGLAETYIFKAYELNPTNEEAQYEIKLTKNQKRKIRRLQRIP